LLSKRNRLFSEGSETALLVGLANVILPLARSLARSISPSLYRVVSYRRNEAQVERVQRKLLARYGTKVVGGPFAGMEYVGQSVGSALAPKLIGCYEEELHPFIERAISKRCVLVIDIGAAEGYYAVGFALRLPGARVWAFDGNPLAQELCREVAARNGLLDRILVRGSCDVPALCEVLAEGALVVCDCEGDERVLLDPEVLPLLGSCDLLVETHDWLVPGVSKLLSNRFRATHDIEEVESRPREPSAYPALHFLRHKERGFALQEFRPLGQRWLFMTVRLGSQRRTCSESVGAGARALSPQYRSAGPRSPNS
jgi:hypothetical protein